MAESTGNPQALLLEAGVPLPPHAEHLAGCRWPKEWAARVGVSRRTLARHCRETGVLRPGLYVQLAQLLPAVAELHKGEPLHVVATRHGYPSPFDMSNRCVRVLGLRPSALRTMDWRATVRQRFAGSTEAMVRHG